ncbi:hypothetical protein OU415_24175 [Saccharopolyspora sp. WRP15-2]|uniref:Gram-positive cocci surface proteins LPxTG domain-containing protein n=1 Tax=Saccharopolyspora oryzae TaxID=2997343 RepID=A0ABT4V3K4_9PSEU|nr:hypothetical protein [Saccharopolyspora oryzae]MDA3628551.1 hypothetical protein [Saccharopolyspora oryzae]
MIRAAHSILAAVAAVAVAAAPAATAQQAVAESSLLQLNVTAVPEAGVGGFSGELGSAATGPGDRLVSWDQSDPEGVRSHVNGWYGGPPPPGTSTARASDSTGSREASAAWSSFGISATSGGPNLLSFGALHTWARCTQPPLANQEEAYAATDSNTIYLFDDVTRPLPAGTSTVQTTGARMGLSGIGAVTLAVDVTRIEETYAHGAHAAIRVQVHAVMHDASGATVFDGELMDVTAGDVRVECEAETPPTSTTEPTTTEPSEPTTTTELPTPEPPTTETPEPPDVHTTTTEPPTTSEPTTSTTEPTTSESPTSTTEPTTTEPTTGPPEPTATGTSTCPEPPPTCEHRPCPEPPEPTCHKPPGGGGGWSHEPTAGGGWPGGDPSGGRPSGGVEHLAKTGGVPTGPLSLAGGALAAAGALLLLVLRKRA